MYWLDNNTGIPTAPTIPPVISSAKRYFTNGGAGVPPSVPEDSWFNMIQEELLAVLNLAGISPDKADQGQLAKAVQSIVFSGCPVGIPFPWPTAVPPAGFLAMNGQSFNPLTYPKLALAYPSGVLKDLRGEFIRGWDNGRGIDTGRTILSDQIDLFGSHTHSIYVGYAQGGPTAAGGPYRVSGTNNDGEGPYPDRMVASGGNETRPKNVAFNYIVRAA